MVGFPVGKNVKKWPVIVIAITVALATVGTHMFNQRRQAVDSKSSKNNDLADSGKVLFSQFGCFACHQENKTRLGPSLHGILGRVETLVDGSNITVDEAYIRESIVYPQKKIVAGYTGVMPPFEGVIQGEQLDQLVAYILCLQ